MTKALSEKKAKTDALGLTEPERKEVYWAVCDQPAPRSGGVGAESVKESKECVGQVGNLSYSCK
ncbi:MAG: hypothetical protein AB1600_02580 [Bacteroidota bacterium]